MMADGPFSKHKVLVIDLASECPEQCGCCAMSFGSLGVTGPVEIGRVFFGP